MQKGFAGIYLLIGVVLIGVVAGGVYYFSRSFDKPTVDQTNPVQQKSSSQQNQTLTEQEQLNFFAKSRNLWRKQSLYMMMDYLSKYTTDNDGKLPPIITTTNQKIAKSEADLCSYIIPKYDNKLNKDTGTENSEFITDCSSDYNTGFTIVKDEHNLVTISSPFAELGEIISMSKQF